MSKELKLTPQWRSVEIARAASDDQRAAGDESYEISFASEEPYERWWGIEILGHKKDEVDLSWMTSGRAPLLVDHDARVDSMVGVVEKAWIEGGRAKALVRFGKGARAQDIKARVDSGELSSISVGYRIEEMQLVKSQKNGPSTYRATKWKPHEASLVAIPADPTVGVGRNDDAGAMAVRILKPETKTETKGTSTMDDELKAALAAAEARGVKGAFVPTENTPKVEQKSNDQILADERRRVDEITKVAKRFNKGALGDEHIGKGTTAAEFNGIILTSIGAEEFAEKNMNANTLGLSKKEAQRFSFSRLIASSMDAQPARAMLDLAKFEREVCEAEGKRALKADRKVRGNQFSIPVDVLRMPLMEGARDLLVGTPTAGGNLVQTDLLSGSFIDLLRNRMMVAKMGATVFNGLEGMVAIPRQSGGGTFYWVAENGAPTESQQTVDQVPLAPKTGGAFTDFSRRLMLQSSLDVEAFVRNDLINIISLGVDLAALHGTGAANQPLGLAGQNGVNVVALGANGAAPSWANIIQMETEVAVDNADVNNMGYLTNAKVRGKLKSTEKAATTGMFIWGDGQNGMGSLNGYKAGVSNQVRSDMTKGASAGITSGIFFGNWADLIIGMWSGIDLLVDPFTGGTAGTVRVIGMQDVDIAVRHGESFSYINDALTT